jgi:hypothetical protein
VQDYQFDDTARVLSGVRNITAGVLLLFKEKLRRLSPPDSDEVLLKQRVIPTQNKNGEIAFRGSGKKTVDVQQITERFKSLGIEVNWKPVNDIVELRNEIEHYYTGATASRLRELIASTFVIVRDFTTIHLGITPFELLGEDTWQHILTVGEVYQKELEECTSARADLEWPGELRDALEPHVRCPGCYGADAYETYKDGGDPPYEECPECGRDTYIVQRDVCAACGYERQYMKCAVCHSPLGAGEQIHEGLCGYHAWAAHKDD